MDSVTVSFRYQTAHITLNYPVAITGMPINSLKKLFKYMISDWHWEENEDAVKITRRILQDYVEETKNAWQNASAEFTEGYTDTKYKFGVDTKDAEASNKKLLANVKKAKTKAERAKKLLSIFEENITKYSNEI